MKILKTRMVKFYPHLCLEAEAIDSEGITFYVNISLPWNKGERMNELLDDEWWSYLKPLSEVDMDNNDECYWGDEAKEAALKLVEMYDRNPEFKEYDWKEI